MGKLAWILFFALAAILDPASCCTQEVPESGTSEESPSAALSQASPKTPKDLVASPKTFSLAAAASILTLAFLAVSHWRPREPEGAAEAPEAAVDLEELAAWGAEAPPQNAAEHAEAAGDLATLRAWRTRALKLVRALEAQRAKIADDVEVAVRKGIPLVVQAQARTKDPSVIPATREDLRKEVEASKLVLRRASTALTGPWIDRAEHMRLKLEDAVQAVRDGMNNLPPGALTGAKDELMVQLRRLKRTAEVATAVHKTLKKLAEDPMPVSPVYKKIQELEYAIQVATMTLLGTVRTIQMAWETQAQALEKVIERGGPDAPEARRLLASLEKSMVADLNRIKKLYQVSLFGDFMPK